MRSSSFSLAHALTDVGQYPRGSEWRRWDLQVHTPYSELNNSFSQHFPKYAKALLDRAYEKRIAVVGVTDYFSIEGYKELRELLSDREALTSLVGADVAAYAANILFLANVELRTSTIVRSPDRKDSRVNFHVVFADSVSVEDIEENFLRELKFTAESNPDSKDERWSLTVKNLAELGRRLKAQHRKFQDGTDLFVGMMNAVVDHSDVSDVLESRRSTFDGKYLLCLPADEDLSMCSWDGQGHLSRKLLLQKSHALFSSNRGTREFALGKRHPSPEDYVAEFKSLKPCLHSSDAHKDEELFNPTPGTETWVKADPSFYGLKQVLNEPADRVWIGEIPPSMVRVQQRPTRVIRSVAIYKLPSATTPERWFNCDILLNPELVAVIGNKGSGKSALSDIIGLLGGTPRHEAFSFLNQGRFRKPRDNKARQFRASLTWIDGTTDSVPTLDIMPDADAVEKIKYIPQNYLEEICNEIGSGKAGRFYRELQQVIFSHVPLAERLGFSTLDELLEHRGEETKEAIAQIVQELHQLNGDVVSMEERLAPANRKSIEAQLIEKRRELDAHGATKPAEVLKPEADVEAQRESQMVAEDLEASQLKLRDIEAELAELSSQDSAAVLAGATAEKVLGKIRNFKRQYDSFLSDLSGDFENIGVEVGLVLDLRIDTTAVDDLVRSTALIRAEIEAKCSADISDSPAAAKKGILAAIEALQSKLSAPQRAFQAYLKSLKLWEDRRGLIVGDAVAPGSIRYLEKQLTDLDTLPTRLAELRAEQERKLREIYREKQKLRNYYESYYGSVRRFLTQHPLAAGEQFQLTFNVAIAEHGFSEALLGKLNRRKTGSFMGDAEGASALRRLLESADFESEEGAREFTKSLFAALRSYEGKPVNIKDQLRQGTTVQDVYDYVYSLGFLSPVYNLQWDGKTLEQLSPGERGNLLLIFYLLVDIDDIPLVIDQPEENLDNQTVFKTLVPCIKDAKSRRQIIMVTHNPNLAVVCDAEQVIYAEHKKEDQNSVIYSSGSIEDPFINRRIVDVLEGTKPAFNKRGDKYLQ
ncbi:MAG: hypothetical protein NTZ56_01100 [Acidobacteria bacterium]|nr:hypothetical protein [Acidobacteriota bacterium]